MKNEIKNFRIEPLVNPSFIHSSLARYSQNGIEKSWEVVKAHDSVAILIYHTTKDSFVLVKQFRPAVYRANGDGMTLELCAGIVDKDISLERIAQEEIAEECGYNVPLNNIQKITSFYTSVGFAGSRQELYYAEINDSMKFSEGGGVDGELIEVVEVSTDKAKEFIYNEEVAKSTGLMFAFLWWFDRG